MKPVRAFLVLLMVMPLMLAATGQAPPSEDPQLKKARELFDLYVRLEHTFDLKAADLYADDALIRNKRIYPTGQVREATIPAPQYKELIRRLMPVAKEIGDVNTYTEVRYTREGEGVRITASRFSEMKKYKSPISILAKPTPDGTWLIFEELSESRPS